MEQAEVHDPEAPLAWWEWVVGSAQIIIATMLAAGVVVGYIIWAIGQADVPATCVGEDCR